eukprot:1152230-Pelagomonas_calceolata.AAC.3
MLRNIARLHKHAHNLRVETSLWQEQTSACERCDQGELQDEEHAAFLCSSGSRRGNFGSAATMQGARNPGQPSSSCSAERFQACLVCSVMTRACCAESVLQAVRTLPTSSKKKGIPTAKAPCIPLTKENKKRSQWGPGAEK